MTGDGEVLVRDSEDPPVVVRVSPSAWRAFCQALRTGTLAEEG